MRLPYEPEKGIVWEYDGVGDYYINLVDTKIDENEQVFVFEGKADFKGLMDKYSNMFNYASGHSGNVMDLVFTDKNGNEKLYYTFFSAKEPDIYPAEECYTAEYTVSPQTSKDGYLWTCKYSPYVLIQDVKEGNTQTFTVVAMPSQIENQSPFIVDFSYNNKSAFAVAEKMETIFAVEDGKIVVTRENRNVY